jgi:hypothetical protein
MERAEIFDGRVHQRLGHAEATDVCIADIKVDGRIPHDLYESTFVRSLVMTPIGKEPPVGAVGAYWGHIYAAQAHEVETLEILAEALNETITRIRSNQQEHAL